MVYRVLYKRFSATPERFYHTLDSMYLMLSTFAEVHVENIKDTDAMQHLLNQLLFTVRTVEEAKQAIVDASAEEIEE